jgi:hypothetical protein
MEKNYSYSAFGCAGFTGVCVSKGRFTSPQSCFLFKFQVAITLSLAVNVDGDSIICESPDVLEGLEAILPLGLEGEVLSFPAVAVAGRETLVYEVGREEGMPIPRSFERRATVNLRNDKMPSVGSKKRTSKKFVGCRGERVSGGAEPEGREEASELGDIARGRRLSGSESFEELTNMNAIGGETCPGVVVPRTLNLAMDATSVDKGCCNISHVNAHEPPSSKKELTSSTTFLTLPSRWLRWSGLPPYGLTGKIWTVRLRVQMAAQRLS